MISLAEQQAEVADAQRRADECRTVIAKLLPDRDDAQVLSEITSLMRDLRNAQAVLKAAGIDPHPLHDLQGGPIESLDPAS